MNPSSAISRPQIFAVSDATGATAELVVRAALAQFQMVDVEIRRLPNIRTVDEVRRAIRTAQASKGIVIHTLVSDELRRAALREGRKLDVATIDLLGPLLLRLTDLLRIPPLVQPGLFRELSVDYLRRIEVIEYTVKHDDGQDPVGLDRADIVLVGVSRTSKTPLSIYLAGKGWRVANVPIILNLPVPGQLTKIDQGRVVGLILSAERLVELRRARMEHQDAPFSGGYADLEEVRLELRYSRSLFRKASWPVIDVTSKSIEEAASEVLALIATHEESVTVPEEGPRARRRKAAKGHILRRVQKTA